MHIFKFPIFVLENCAADKESPFSYFSMYLAGATEPGRAAVRRVRIAVNLARPTTGAAARPHLCSGSLVTLFGVRTWSNSHGILETTERGKTQTHIDTDRTKTEIM